MASHRCTLHIIVWLLQLLTSWPQHWTVNSEHRCNLPRMRSGSCGAAADNIHHASFMPAEVTPCLWYSAASSLVSSLKVEIIPVIRLSFSFRYFMKIFFSKKYFCPWLQITGEIIILLLLPTCWFIGAEPRWSSGNWCRQGWEQCLGIFRFRKTRSQAGKF